MVAALESIKFHQHHNEIYTTLEVNPLETSRLLTPVRA